MSAPPRSRPTRSRLRRRLATLLALSWWALQGCTPQTDPLRDYADGAEVELEGVLRFPATAQGDFVPGRLLGRLEGGGITSAQLRELRETLLPGVTIQLGPDDSDELAMVLPPGMSLGEAASRVQPAGIFTNVYPDYSAAGSTALTLRKVDESRPLGEAEVVATLVAENLERYRHYSGNRIVTVRAKTRDPDGDFTPEDPLLIVDVVAGAGFAVQLTGTPAVREDSGRCMTFETSDHGTFELVGAQTVALASAGLVGREVVVRGRDLGLSSTSCSGGPQLMLETFEAFAGGST